MTTETKALTPWAVHLIQQLEKVTPFFELQLDTYTLQLLPTNDTLAICMRDVNGTTLVFRTAYSPAGELRLIDSDTNGQVLQYRLESPAGTYTVDLDVQSPEHSKGIHYTVHFVPNEDLHIPFWPNDLLVLDRDYGGSPSRGTKRHSQRLGLFQYRRTGSRLHYVLPKPFGPKQLLYRHRSVDGRRDRRGLARAGFRAASRRSPYKKGKS